MSTHNIGFNEDLTKIIFELSSNIIKYAPYFFCCILIITKLNSPIPYNSAVLLPYTAKYLSDSPLPTFYSNFPIIYTS